MASPRWQAAWHPLGGSQLLCKNCVLFWKGHGAIIVFNILTLWHAGILGRTTHYCMFWLLFTWVFHVTVNSSNTLMSKPQGSLGFTRYSDFASCKDHSDELCFVKALNFRVKLRSDLISTCQLYQTCHIGDWCTTFFGFCAIYFNGSWKLPWTHPTSYLTQYKHSQTHHLHANIHRS